MTAATLTDRYAWAVLRSIPEGKRADIDRELRASIADAVDARVENGEPAAAAERAVLLELGDPARLAADYAGRPLALIGPALYVDYVRLLRVLLLAVLPIVTIVLVVLNAVGGAGIGDLIGTAVTTVLTVGVHLCFWTTLVFVLLDRTGAKSPLVRFDPDQLPAIPTPTSVKVSDLVANVVFAVLVVGVLVGQQTAGLIRDAAGAPLPILDPSLWSFWIPFLIGASVLTVVHALVLYRVGRWTWPLFLSSAVLVAAGTGPVAALILRGEFFNPGFVAGLDWGAYLEPGSIAVTVTVAALVGSGIWAVIDALVKTIRSSRER